MQKHNDPLQIGDIPELQKAGLDAAKELQREAKLRREALNTAATDAEGNKSVLITGLAGDINKSSLTPQTLLTEKKVKVFAPGVELDFSKPLRDQGHWVVFKKDENELTATAAIELVTAFIQVKELEKLGIDYARFYRLVWKQVHKTRFLNKSAGGTGEVSVMLEPVVKDALTSLEVDKLRAKGAKGITRMLNKGKKKSKQQKNARKANRK